MKFSIILAYRPDNGIRDMHFKWTLNRYTKIFPEADIVVSQDTGKGWDTFNKSSLINKGVAKAKYDSLLITDIDVIFARDTILKGLQDINNHCMIMPMNTLWWINQYYTYAILRQKPTSALPTVDLTRQKKQLRIGYRPNGWHIMSKKTFEDVNGYDENFVGWGSEDSCFIKSVVTTCELPFSRLNAEAYHLWHPVDKCRHRKRNVNHSRLIVSYKEAFKNKDKMLILNSKKRG